MLTIDRYGQREDVAGQVVAGHIRGQLATQPFDIASSDRHTVKPWFTSRLPESPQVPDLAAQGFVLVGGRVDVVGHDPVATIVYKHAKHTVSLTTLPAASVASVSASTVETRPRAGRVEVMGSLSHTITTSQSNNRRCQCRIV
jgi:anti-sigma factor RsiW